MNIIAQVLGLILVHVIADVMTLAPPLHHEHVCSGSVVVQLGNSIIQYDSTSCIHRPAVYSD